MKWSDSCAFHRGKSLSEYPDAILGIVVRFRGLVFIEFVGTGWLSLPRSEGAGSAIDGDTISGIVFQNGKPLRHAQVKVYVSSTGKTSWVWRTDQEGKFTTPKLRRGAYRVDITGWGNAQVKVGTEQEQSGQQTINWTVDFGDDGCVGIDMDAD